MKTTQTERDVWRNMLGCFDDGDYVCGTMTALDMERLLDDADLYEVVRLKIMRSMGLSRWDGVRADVITSILDWADSVTE